MSHIVRDAVDFCRRYEADWVPNRKSERSACSHGHFSFPPTTVSSFYSDPNKPGGLERRFEAREMPRQHGHVSDTISKSIPYIVAKMQGTPLRMIHIKMPSLS